jgi:hypothetical protein
MSRFFEVRIFLIFKFKTIHRTRRAVHLQLSITLTIAIRSFSNSFLLRRTWYARRSACSSSIHRSIFRNCARLFHTHFTQQLLQYTGSEQKCRRTVDSYALACRLCDDGAEPPIGSPTTGRHGTMGRSCSDAADDAGAAGNTAVNAVAEAGNERRGRKRRIGIIDRRRRRQWLRRPRLWLRLLDLCARASHCD